DSHALPNLPEERRLRPPEIYRELAKLGCFVGSKSDGEPRWITLWRGFEKLQLILRGINYYDTTCG
ncbi:MAG: hypothetical protein ACKVHE_32000, partial [Planctomycetales bacterium]